MAVVLVRRERADDVAAVRAVVAAAFARPDTGADPPVEVVLLDALRTDAGWLPALSLVVAEPPTGEVIGHVVCTRATIDGAPVLGLGPLAVRPDRQRRGVGTALMHAVLGAAEAVGEPLVVLLGDPAFYGRFGFRAASEYGIEAPDPGWGKYFQARPLGAEPVRGGAFRYAAPFEGL